MFYYTFYPFLILSLSLFPYFLFQSDSSNSPSESVFNPTLRILLQSRQGGLQLLPS